MIRILHVVTHMNRGGLETMLMNYYRHMDRNKIQFDFLTHREYDGDYGEEIIKLGGKIFHLPFLNPISHHYRSALRSFFEDHPEYKIVHVHQDCLSSIILKEAYKCGIPIRIAHSHSSSQEKNLKYIIKFFYKQFIPQYATKLMSCGLDAGRWMFNKHQFTVINNAIEAKDYVYDESIRDRTRKQLRIQDKTIVIGHVGNFTIPKNHEGIIKIFTSASKKTDALLILIGDGELRDKIEKKVENLGITDKVLFMGLRKDVNVLLQAMDVFILPSLYEGVPLALVEAQAAGLPCIVSDRVPPESFITDLVKPLMLKSIPNSWTEPILSSSKTVRRNTYNEIVKAGYDIITSAQKLQYYYLQEEENAWKH